MMNFKQHIAKQMVGQVLRFKCTCVLPFDIIGTIRGFEIINNEIIFDVETNNKIIKIGENHPNLEVSEFC